ncbi:MAG: hypothetical protein K0Q74_236 [Gammaproteobacteria bacterium]|jgi:hypothetical protein|nr:hypothetical protein [Gammaproteobacteria bacterium]
MLEIKSDEIDGANLRDEKITAHPQGIEDIRRMWGNEEGKNYLTKMVEGGLDAGYLSIDELPIYIQWIHAPEAEKYPGFEKILENMWCLESIYRSEQFEEKITAYSEIPKEIRNMWGNEDGKQRLTQMVQRCLADGHLSISQASIYLKLINTPDALNEYPEFKDARFLMGEILAKIWQLESIYRLGDHTEQDINDWFNLIRKLHSNCSSFGFTEQAQEELMQKMLIKILQLEETYLSGSGNHADIIDYFKWIKKLHDSCLSFGFTEKSQEKLMRAMLDKVLQLEGMYRRGYQNEITACFKQIRALHDNLSPDFAEELRGTLNRISYKISELLGTAQAKRYLPSDFGCLDKPVRRLLATLALLQDVGIINGDRYFQYEIALNRIKQVDDEENILLEEFSAEILWDIFKEALKDTQISDPEKYQQYLEYFSTIIPHLYKEKSTDKKESESFKFKNLRWDSFSEYTHITSNIILPKANQLLKLATYLEQRRALGNNLSNPSWSQQIQLIMEAPCNLEKLRTLLALQSKILKVAAQYLKKQKNALSVYVEQHVNVNKEITQHEVEIWYELINQPGDILSRIVATESRRNLWVTEAEALLKIARCLEGEGVVRTGPSQNSWSQQILSILKVNDFEISKLLELRPEVLVVGKKWIEKKKAYLEGFMQMVQGHADSGQITQQQVGKLSAQINLERGETILEQIEHLSALEPSLKRQLYEMMREQEHLNKQAEKEKEFDEKKACLKQVIQSQVENGQVTQHQGEQLCQKIDLNSGQKFDSKFVSWEQQMEAFSAIERSIKAELFDMMEEQDTLKIGEETLKKFIQLHVDNDQITEQQAGNLLKKMASQIDQRVNSTSEQQMELFTKLNETIRADLFVMVRENHIKRQKEEESDVEAKREALPPSSEQGGIFGNFRFGSIFKGKKEQQQQQEIPQGTAKGKQDADLPNEVKGSSDVVAVVSNQIG